MPKNENKENIAQALIEFGQIIVEDRKEIRKDIRELTNAVKTLTLSDAESRKDSEHRSKQMERMEDNQKEQGKEIKNLSDHTILNTEKLVTIERKQDKKDKITTGVVIALTVIAIVAIFQSITPFIG